MKIGIIGGGIIGLTTGVVLSEAGYEVEIFTAAPIEYSTSWAAGAISYPFGVEQSFRVLSWWKKTDEILELLLGEPDAGILRANWRRLASKDTITMPEWFMQFGGRAMAKDEIPSPYNAGITAPYLVMAVDRYVPYMRKRFMYAGGIYTIRAIDSLQDLPEGFDLWVNATGVEARNLAQDKSVYPARGQVVIVKNPGVRFHTALEDRKFYCYPRGDQCLLGGSFDENEWDRTHDPSLTKEILSWAGQTEPLLAKPEVLDVRVGLRPMRPMVRLERDKLRTGKPLIHNYGHGGAGYTLSWGCAFEVLNLVQTA